MRSAARWVSVVLVGIVEASTVATVARAESIDRRVRLGIDAGIAEKQLDGRETMTAGLGSMPVGPVIGFGLSERVLIGARLELAHRSGSGGLDGDTFGAGLTATLAYVGGDGNGAVRPFIGPLLGVRVASTELGPYTQDEHAVTFGAQAGIHAFPIANFSIDPTLVVGYLTGTSSVSYPPSFAPGPFPAEADISGFVIGVRLAVSGWFGGKAAQKSSVAPEPEAYRAPAYPSQSYPPTGYPQQQPAYPQQQPAYPQQQPAYPQQQPAYPQQQPGYQAPPSSPPPTSSSPRPALPPPAPAP